MWDISVKAAACDTRVSQGRTSAGMHVWDPLTACHACALVCVPVPAQAGGGAGRVISKRRKVSGSPQPSFSKVCVYNFAWGAIPSCSKSLIPVEIM
jgi:hypothetical protein